MKLSHLHFSILKLVNSAGDKGVTTTELIRFGMNRQPPTQSAERRARELRVNGYLSEDGINDDEMLARGLKTKVGIYHINNIGRVWLQRLADLHPEWE